MKKFVHKQLFWHFAINFVIISAAVLTREHQMRLLVAGSVCFRLIHSQTFSLCALPKPTRKKCSPGLILSVFSAYKKYFSYNLILCSCKHRVGAENFRPERIFYAVVVASKLIFRWFLFSICWHVEVKRHIQIGYARYWVYLKLKMLIALDVRSENN